jgi:hypothetical protein
MPTRLRQSDRLGTLAETWTVDPHVTTWFEKMTCERAETDVGIIAIDCFEGGRIEGLPTNVNSLGLVKTWMKALLV